MDEFKLMDDVKKALCYVSMNFTEELYSTKHASRVLKVCCCATRSHAVNFRTQFQLRNKGLKTADFANSLMNAEASQSSLKKYYVLPDFQTITKVVET
jgi:hypothetical protein